VLESWDRLIDYLTTVLAREQADQFRILFLDSRNQLLADEAQARGTVHIPVYRCEVVKRALELHATALILVHNHPSSDPSPGRDDVQMTGLVKQAAAALSITLHDHVIVGNGRWFSFRQEGVLEAIHHAYNAVLHPARWAEMSSAPSQISLSATYTTTSRPTQAIHR